MCHTPSVSAEVCSSEAPDRIARKLEEKKQSMLNSRTAVLWIKYMEMVDTLKLFIKAERTGNWMLHLKALHEMLPYFAAAGHTLTFSYANKEYDTNSEFTRFMLKRSVYDR